MFSMTPAREMGQEGCQVHLVTGLAASPVILGSDHSLLSLKPR